MKKWHWRTIIILAMGVAGTAAIGLQPMFRDNTAEIVTTEQLAVSPLTTHDHGQSINFEYKWSTADLPTHTEVYGNLTPSAFNKIQPITWNFRVYTEDGELKVKHDTPVPIPLSNMDNAKAEYAVYFIGNTLHRRPNGSMVAEHRLCLECELTVTPSFWGKPLCTVLRQSLVIDVAQGTVDLEEPQHIFTTPGTVVITKGSTPTLPSRYCGTPREQAIQKLLYEFADLCKNPTEHKLNAFADKAQQNIDTYCTPDKAWPDCWEEAAGEAQRASRLIEDTVSQLYHADFYNSPLLTDFIASPAFARIFGEEFTLQDDNGINSEFGTGTENIEFEFIPAENTPTNENF